MIHPNLLSAQLVFLQIACNVTVSREVPTAGSLGRGHIRYLSETLTHVNVVDGHNCSLSKRR